jgi:hypothetical protein
VVVAGGAVDVVEVGGAVVDVGGTVLCVVLGVVLGTVLGVVFGVVGTTLGFAGTVLTLAGTALACAALALATAALALARAAAASAALRLSALVARCLPFSDRASEKHASLIAWPCLGSNPKARDESACFLSKVTWAMSAFNASTREV